MKRYPPVELYFWGVALLYLAWADPAQTHFSFCLFERLGISFCPGCGLGRSVAYLLDGEIARSWEAHKLGFFALSVILHRVMRLIIQNHKHYGQSVPGAQIHHAH